MIPLPGDRDEWDAAVVIALRFGLMLGLAAGAILVGGLWWVLA